MQKRKIRTLALAMLFSVFFHYIQLLAVLLVTEKFGQELGQIVSCVGITLSFGLPTLIYCKLEEVKLTELFTIKNANERTRTTLKTVLLFIFAFAMTVAAVNFFGMLYDLIFHVEQESPYNTPPQFVLLFLRNVLIAPVIEEILFRGVVLNAIDDFKRYKRILLSALLFAISHYDTAAFLYAFLAGMILAYFAIRTGSLKFVIGVHLAQNLITFVYSVLIVFGEGVMLFLVGVIALAVFWSCFVIGVIGLIFMILEKKLFGGKNHA